MNQDSFLFIPHPSSFIPSDVVQGVGFEPTYGFRRPGLQPGAINHSTTPAFCQNLTSRRRDLNPRPSDYKSDALPTELRRHTTVEIRAFRQNVNTSNAFRKTQAAGRASALRGVNKLVDAPARRKVGWEVAQGWLQKPHGPAYRTPPASTRFRER